MCTAVIPHYSAPFFGITQVAAYFTGRREILQKVYDAVLPLFRPYTALYQCGIGIKDLLCNNRDKSARTDVFENKKLKTRGIAYIGAGICDACIALYSFAVLDLKTSISKISFIGHICFLYANLITLEENIHIFRKEYDSFSTSEQSKLLTRSAFLGIIGSLGYILSSALTIFSPSTAIALLLSIFALGAGFLKLIIDFYNEPGKNE